MKIADCYCLGRITKPWGVKGQLVLFLDVDTPEDYLELDSAFVEVKGQLVPHFFHIDQLNGNKAVATFEEMTPEQALSLVGHELYLPLDLLPKLEGNKFYFHEVIGFRVVDEVHGDIGTLEQVIEYPAQPLFQVMKNGVEILIPVIDPVIKKVDRKLKTIFIEAPNGLIDLYLGESNKGC
ncbi:MAG: 16S rRNA processing protein RimM [Bacteroidales bacterium]|nr:16S rRNA processing protein RimM [Bacteroidales bacterium]